MRFRNNSMLFSIFLVVSYSLTAMQQEAYDEQQQETEKKEEQEENELGVEKRFNSLYDYLRKGDFNSFEGLFKTVKSPVHGKSHEDFDSGSKWLWRLLYDAIEYDKIEFFEFLLSKGMNTNVQHPMGYTPLSYTLDRMSKTNTSSNLKKFVEILLKRNDIEFYHISEEMSEYARNKAERQFALKTAWAGVVDLFMNNEKALPIIQKHADTLLEESMNWGFAPISNMLVSDKRLQFSEETLLRMARKFGGYKDPQNNVESGYVYASTLSNVIRNEETDKLQLLLTKTKTVKHFKEYISGNRAECFSEYSVERDYEGHTNLIYDTDHNNFPLVVAANKKDEKSLSILEEHGGIMKTWKTMPVSFTQTISLVDEISLSSKLENPSLNLVNKVYSMNSSHGENIKKLNYINSFL